MRKIILLAVALAAIAGGLWAYFARRPATSWTCVSPEARREFELGIEAQRKLYMQESWGHFEKALEIAPDFAMAQLRVALGLRRDDPRREELVAQLEEQYRSALSPREVFLIDYYLARHRDDLDEATRILTEYRQTHPRDPYALDLACEERWGRQDYAAAEESCQELLRLDPNWVTAQNRLGYLAMSQGDFAKAEDRFRSYRFVAPDQANPHDSLGELLILVGRYDEAESELREALDMRPDFCASYQNLILLSALRGRADDGLTWAAKAAEHCEDRAAVEMACFARLLGQMEAQRWEELAGEWQGGCYEKPGAPLWMPHLGAVMAGDLATARAIEAFALEQIGERFVEPKEDSLWGVRHMQGLRLLAEGEAAESAAALATADEQLSYFGLGMGLLKLFNRLQLAEARARTGDEAGAAALLAAVEAVNPDLADAYRDGEIVLVPEPAGARAD